MFLMTVAVVQSDVHLTYSSILHSDCDGYPFPFIIVLSDVSRMEANLELLMGFFQ